MAYTGQSSRASRVRQRAPATFVMVPVAGLVTAAVVTVTVVALLMASVRGGAPTQREEPISPRAVSRVSDAYEALRAESVFVGPRVGFAASVSRESRYVHALLADPHAAELFGRLWSEAETPAGRLYALTGLYLTDRSSFERLAQVVRGSRTEVPTFIGCIVSKRAAADLLEELTTGGMAREFLPNANTAREERFLDSLEAARRGR